MFSTFDLCLLLYVIRLAGWLKHCNLSLSLVVCIRWSTLCWLQTGRAVMGRRWDQSQPSYTANLERWPAWIWPNTHCSLLKPFVGSRDLPLVLFTSTGLLGELWHRSYIQQYHCTRCPHVEIFDTAQQSAQLSWLSARFIHGRYKRSVRVVSAHSHVHGETCDRVRFF